LGSGLCPLLISPGSKGCEAGLSALLGLSPGNYGTKRCISTF
jgi:hypothetical protein